MRHARKPKAQRTSSDDSWQTPPDWFEVIDDVMKFTIDAAADASNSLCLNHWSALNSALNKSWDLRGEVIFCNPPFSQLGQGATTNAWVSKFLEMHEGLIFMKCPIETNYIQTLIRSNHFRLLVPKGRIAYYKNGERETNVGFPSALLVRTSGEKMKRLRIALHAAGFDLTELMVVPFEP